ncbi:DUF1989 domain-containing protein [Nonlabens antarcticus]|uniref:DUF1989 domain-containing protein n=1 Tax=Nonlabens antarcticus TaxID=392714 RepID=UPI001890D7F0|nr:urea carboxylase-associated family protein [Nonlabens antarcticus]
MKIIEKQSGVAFEISEGDFLKIIDISGQQVSDLVCFNATDTREKFSAGKTMDFEESILISTHNYLWSNRGNKMMKIIEDLNGRNDVLLAPCSQQTFEIMYNINKPHPSCYNNLAINLKEFNIEPDEIPTAFNAFMNVQFDTNGKLKVLPPQSQKSDFIILQAMMDLVIGMTACSAPDSNGGSFKEIGYEIIKKTPHETN